MRRKCNALLVILQKNRFISGSVTTLAISALLGEHVTGPYYGQLLKRIFLDLIGSLLY